MNEADTCRTLVSPKLEAAGWDGDKHFCSEQTAFTDGRIMVPGGKPRRSQPMLAKRLIQELNPVSVNQFAAIGDMVATACEPKQ